MALVCRTVGPVVRQPYVDIQMIAGDGFFGDPPPPENHLSPLRTSRKTNLAPLPHSLLMQSSNSFTGFRLHGTYSLNSPPRLSMHCIMHSGRPPYLTDLLHHRQSTRSLRSSSSQQLSFHSITYHLDLVLFASQPHGSGTPCLSAFANPSHFLLLNVISRLTFSN